MAQWIDFLQNKNGDIVYPVGVTSGIFLPNGEKLSVWTKNVNNKFNDIGETATIFIETNEWILSSGEGSAYIVPIYPSRLPKSFLNATKLDHTGEEVSLKTKFIWLPCIGNVLNYRHFSEFEERLIDNASKYIYNIMVEPGIFIAKAHKRPPYTTAITLINLSS